MKDSIPRFLLEVSSYNTSISSGAKLSFLDKTLLKSAKTAKAIYIQSESSASDNFFRKINPYVKLLSLIYFVVMISIANNLNSQILASVFILLLFIAAGIKISDIYRKILFLSFIFGFIVILPASLNIITPGKIVLPVIRLNAPVHFWIYTIPQDIGFTSEGIKVVSVFFFRVLNSVSFALLIVFTTSLPSFLKAFGILGVPDTFMMVISLAYKYIFILARTIEESYLALRSRLYDNIRNKNLRSIVGGRILFIYNRSHAMYDGTYKAMVSRGYQGKLQFYARHQFTLIDLITAVIIASMGVIIILI